MLSFITNFHTFFVNTWMFNVLSFSMQLLTSSLNKRNKFMIELEIKQRRIYDLIEHL